MDKFMLLTVMVIIFVLGYNLGFAIGMKAIKRRGRKKAKKIITRFGETPTPKQQEKIHRDVMDFLYEFFNSKDEKLDD